MEAATRKCRTPRRTTSLIAVSALILGMLALAPWASAKPPASKPLITWLNGSTVADADIAIDASVTTSGGLAAARSAAAGVGSLQDPPNVVLIVTDDQRLEGTMVAMPDTLALFDQSGTEYTSPFTATPLCCPARGSIRSGLYAHNHGVRTNWSGPEQQAYDQTRTIESNLRANGYATAIVGKYWNDWPVSQNPPNWDRWAVFSGGFNNMTFNVNGQTAVRQGYTTNVQMTYADQFLSDFEANDAQPWYLYLTPQAPHSPTTPEQQYASASVADHALTPAMLETDRGDKPKWVRNTGSSPQTQTSLNNTVRPQLRTLMSVDDLIADVFARLTALGEENTVAIFTSDNGYMWGEHGMSAKRWPYMDSVRIPLYVRWPGHVIAGTDDSKLVSHVDIAPTIYDAAGVVPSYVPDGRSLFAPGERERLFLEYFRSPDSMTPRTWASIVTPTLQYTEWYDGSTTVREYYDLVADPWQLTNLLGDANQANNPDVTELSALLLADRLCSGIECPGPVVTVPDVLPPSTPGIPVATSTVAGRVDVVWGASQDEQSASLTYRVFRDGQLAGSVLSSSTAQVSFLDAGLTPLSTHTYSVEAEDAQHNVSERSAESDPVTIAEPPPPQPHVFADDFSSGLAAWTNAGLTLDATQGSPSSPSARAMASNARRYLDRSLPSPLAEVCVSAAFNLQSIGSGQTVTLIRLRSGTNGPLARLYVNATRELKLKNDVTTTQTGNAGTLPSGWHRLELCARIQGVSGQLQLLADGVLRTTFATNLGTAPASGVRIFDDALRTFTANADDVLVDQVPGP